MGIYGYGYDIRTRQWRKYEGTRGATAPPTIFFNFIYYIFKK